MAYSELIKNFDRVRAYLRSFYVRGFMHREDFTHKSARSYDNERRRVESWLGDYMFFGQDRTGKRVFLSVDSRDIIENPLFRAFRAKSFTDKDITLHFHILDILSSTGGLPLRDILDDLNDRISEFETDDMPDESTVRRKLKEYADLGLVYIEKQGREKIYRISKDCDILDSWDAAAAFFSESAPLGIIGSFIAGRVSVKFQKFRFKHHYILNTLDSEVICSILQAISEKRLITFRTRRMQRTAFPLKLYIGTQSGRQYLLAWNPLNERFSFHRTDLIDSVKSGDFYECPEYLPEKLERFRMHVWGVSGNNGSRLDHIELTVYAGTEEHFIAGRLEREKRCGSVEQLDDTHWRFSADVFDAAEMLPWLRTFTGRVTDLKCTNEQVVKRFWDDLAELDNNYGGVNYDIS